MVAKPRTRPKTSSSTKATTPEMKTVKVEVGGRSLKIRVGVVTIPPGTYADRQGPSGAHTISPLEKGVTRITRTTSGDNIVTKVDKIELGFGEPLWVPDTPKGVTVRIENTSSKMVVFGKIYPPKED